MFRVSILRQKLRATASLKSSIHVVQCLIICRDVARRHSERCSKRRGRPIQSSQSRGQPRKACSQCAKAKTSCDQRIPCAMCLKYGRDCSYDRVQPVQSADPITTENPQVAAKGIGTASRVPFLLSYTAAGAGDPNDFAHALETLKYADDAATEQMVSAEQTHPHTFPLLLPFFAAELYDFELSNGPNHSTELQTYDAEAQDAHDHVLRDRVGELITLIGSTGRDSTSPPESTVSALFTPSNLSLCIESFFQNAYKHVPIVHEPSFKTETVNLQLLLSVFLVGAVWSYPRDTYFMVFDVIEMVEQCIFESEIFQHVLKNGTKAEHVSLSNLLPLTQAATMLISISFAFPQSERRRRFRERRFSDLISITRFLQANSIKREVPSLPLLDAGLPLDWAKYIAFETTNRYVHQPAWFQYH